jgi:polyketide biosynthesis enoyl-CoA hydratase PksI
MIPVTFTISAEGVATVAMRDEDGRNALSDGFVAALTGALEEAAADPRSRAVVLCGTPEVFCSGASKALLRQLTDGGVAPSDIHLPRRLLALPLPLIAAMEGHAVGGGLAVGLCADIILAAEESRYGCNFMELGLTPGMGTTRLLEYALPPSVATELLFTGELRRGREFVAVGGFNHILPKAQVLPKAMDLALRIAEKPRLAIETLKKSLGERRRRLFEEAFAEEARMHGVVLKDPETRRRIEAQYVE